MKQISWAPKPQRRFATSKQYRRGSIPQMRGSSSLDGRSQHGGEQEEQTGQPYTATWLQTVRSPRSRPCAFRRSSTPRRRSRPRTSTSLKPYMKAREATPTEPMTPMDASRQGRLGRAVEGGPDMVCARKLQLQRIGPSTQPPDKGQTAKFFGFFFFFWRGGTAM